jgi:hypothetical protein
LRARRPNYFCAHSFNPSYPFHATAYIKSLLQVWFADSERNLATALANTSNALGRAVGFFLGPLLVRSADDLPALLYVTLAVVAAPTIAAWAYLPPVPDDPPSEAAATEARRWGGKVATGGGAAAAAGEAPLAQLGLRGALAQARAACASPSFLLAAVGGGAIMAFYGAWSGVLTAALTPPQGRLTDAQAGLLGALVTFAGIAGGALAGWATDRPLLRRALRGVLAALAVASALLFLPLAFALGGSGGGAPSWLSYPLVVALCTLGGAMRGGMDPVYFELAAETAWEAGAGADVSGAVLTFVYHVLLCCVLSVPASQLLVVVLPGMPVVLALGALLLIPLKVQYTRRAER